MAIVGQSGESVARRYAVLRPYLDERQRRLVLAAEAVELGRGGIAVVAPALTALVDPVTRGDPESPLVWTTKSTRNLADALTAAGHPISDRSPGNS